ncbi:MAG: phytanoyl-CoA dioxygenase family protein [Stellaceae bacterium]
MIATIHRHGVALIRDAIPAESLSEVLPPLVTYYGSPDEADAGAAGKHRKWALANGLTGPNLEKEQRLTLAAAGKSIVADCARRYLGAHALAVATDHFLFRCRDARFAPLAAAEGWKHGFHQDHNLIPQSYPMNVWLPLTKIDNNCVGLSLAFPYTTEIFELPLDIDGYLNRNDGWLWTPKMDVGDVLLFHHCTIHGSYVELKPTARYSAEFRVGRWDSRLEIPVEVFG